MSKLDDIFSYWSVNIPDMKLQVEDLIVDKQRDIATNILSEFEKNATVEEFSYLDECVQKTLAGVKKYGET